LRTQENVEKQRIDIHISTSFIHKKEVDLINSFEYDSLQEDSFLINK